MSDSTPAKVKCQDCGYLAVRNQQTRALAETEEVMRQSGEPPPVFVLPHPGRNAVLIYERTPVCFVREFDLPVEAGLADDARAFLNVIRQERVCPKWTQWFQGFTPRDHKEMIDAREQRDWQEARRREDIAYRDEQRRSDLERDERREKTARSQFRLTFWVGMAVIPITLVVLAALLQGAVSIWVEAHKPAPPSANQPVAPAKDQ